MKITILEGRSSQKAAASSEPPSLFRYDPPVSRETMRLWQADLDTLAPAADRRARLILRWEPGDVWQPVQRLLIWMCQDPRWVNTEPWIVAELRKNSPRSNGHYCGIGHCLCALKKNRWVGGVAKWVDREAWRLYRDTGLYGTRWWTIQGHGGGHRFLWEPDELASKLSQTNGGPADTPSPGDLPYAPFDHRVLWAVQQERRAADIVAGLQSVADARATLSLEDKRRAQEAMNALMSWSDERAYALWHDGAELMPRYFEDTYGRVPTGSLKPLDAERLEEQLTAVH